MTGCTCPVAGYCARHKRKKLGRIHWLCQNDPRFFERFEQIAKGEPRKATRKHQEHHDKQIEQFHALWKELHTYKLDQWDVATAERWFEYWLRRVPNTSCRCKDEATKILAQVKFEFGSQELFFVSGVRLHNAVNRKLSKRELTVEEAREGWDQNPSPIVRALDVAMRLNGNGPAI